MRRRLRGVGWLPAVAWALAVATAAGGCSRPEGRVAVYPVRGKVLYRGEPPVGALVVLHPASGEKEGVPRPTAKVDQDGSFAVTTYDGDDGAPAGDYTATIEWYKLVTRGGEPKAGPNVIPRKYAAAGDSPWKIKVAEAANDLEPYAIAD